MQEKGIIERIKYLESKSESRVRSLDDIRARTEKAHTQATAAIDNVRRLQIDIDSLRIKTNKSLDATEVWCKEIIEKTDSNTCSIAQLKHNISHLTMQSEQCQTSLNMLSDSLKITQSTIMSVNEKITVNKPDAKKSAWSQIPLKAWITGGAVLIIVLIYLKTGKLITIKEITG